MPTPAAVTSKIDTSKLRLYSVTRRSSSGPTAAASRCSSADAQKFSRGVSNTATSLTSATAASRTASKDSYSREGSKASALTRRSMSSEDARRLAKERMSRPPDIAPVRGGNINIENVTPEYVQEFWTRKKMESDEFRRRRQQLAEGQAKMQTAIAQGGATATDKAPAHGRQPLRVSRPVATKSMPAKSIAPPSTTATAGKPTRSVSPPQRTTSPKNGSVSGAVRPRSASGSSGAAGKVPAGSRPSPPQPQLIKRVGGTSTSSPTSLPVARRLLVGTALSRAGATPTPQDSSPVGRPGSAAAVRPVRPTAVASSSVNKKGSGPTTAAGASTKAMGTASSPAASAPPRSILSSKHTAAAKAAPPPGTLPKRVHIDPTTAADKQPSVDDAPPPPVAVSPIPAAGAAEASA